jgi:hypothetical protein
MIKAPVQTVMRRQPIKKLSLYALTITLAAMLGFLPCPARAEMTDYPFIKLQSLDKTTARTMVFEARVGSTIKFGPIYNKVQSCRKAPPIEKPESAAFLQIWENIPPDNKPQWIFSGWMFASSPALSPMDHPVFDVWVIDCLESENAGQNAEVGITDRAKSAAEEEPIESVTDSEGESSEDGPENLDEVPH